MEFLEVEKWYNVKFPEDELEWQNSRGGIGKRVSSDCQGKTMVNLLTNAHGV